MDPAHLAVQGTFFGDPRLQTVLIPLLAAVSLIQFLLLIFLWLRLGSLSRKYRSFMAGTPGLSLEDKLLDLVESAFRQDEKIKGLHFAVRQLEQCQQGSVQHVGVVRFNAFPDAGSDLSFAIAVLNGNNDGFVLSSIYGRQESRVYAKPISRGVSDYLLTEEEKAALARAAGK